MESTIVMINLFGAVALLLFGLALVKDGVTDGVQIDPTLYTQYGIRSVPSLVVRCQAGYDVVRGNIHVKQALEKVAQTGDCAQVARQILDAPSNAAGSQP